MVLEQVAIYSRNIGVYRWATSIEMGHLDRIYLGYQCVIKPFYL